MRRSSIRNKNRVLKELENNPIIGYACTKAGVSRATYYRWLSDDPSFADDAYEAQQKGYAHTNDFVESKLLSKIKNDDGPSIRFWLISNHDRYKKALLKTKPGRQKGFAELLAEAMDVVKRHAPSNRDKSNK